MDSMTTLTFLGGLILIAAVQFGYHVGKLQPCPKCKHDRGGASSWKDSAGGF
jgi:hypothetical protein